MAATMELEAAKAALAAVQAAADATEKDIMVATMGVIAAQAVHDATFAACDADGDKVCAPEDCNDHDGTVASGSRPGCRH